MSRAWLVLAAGENRQHGGNRGYDDSPDSHYSWDDTVANHKGPAVGDMIVLWDKASSIGASVIDRIDEEDSTKARLRCPSCRRTRLKVRRHGKKYRCYEKTCRLEFDQPLEEVIEVHAYRSHHAARWVDLGGRLSPEELRSLCVLPSSIQSIRELRSAAFEAALAARGARAELRMIGDRSEERPLAGGHKTARVRVRVGQGAFRGRLLERFSRCCAFTGLQHEAVLEAAHLYRYADLGEHHEDGGLLLRRDLHTLFDLGLVAVDPDRLVIDIHPDLMPHEDYRALHGRSLSVNLEGRARSWLADHWSQHRAV